ncbi:hypothetical protein AALC17_20475 [Oscillospiraceae bacterium 38-13]
MTATTEQYGAGIGSGDRSPYYSITINGGTITAIGVDCSAGIGGGGSTGNGIITITGGIITAQGGIYAAGIGCGRDASNNNGRIEISGGVVTATGGGYGAGIGGGFWSDGSTILITGGNVTANGGGGGAGIGGGDGGTSGTFSAGGNAFIVADSISDQSGKVNDSWSGVIFEGDSGQIYGSSIILGTNAEIPNGKTLTIEDGQTLAIPDDVSLSNNGSIILQPGGQLVGDVSGSGTVNFLPPAEQFPSLTPGATYWFDLSEEKLPGSANSGSPGIPTPDTTLHWVPFIYAGTIRAYVLNSSSSGRTEASAAASQAAAPDAQYGYTWLTEATPSQRHTAAMPTMTPPAARKPLTPANRSRPRLSSAPWGIRLTATRSLPSPPAAAAAPAR